MDLSRSLRAQLDRLVTDLDADGVGLVPRELEELVTSLSTTIDSFSGLTLTVVHDGQPVTVTALGPPEDEPPRTSLRWTPDPQPGAAPAELILYAGTPGAFVDLAADLSYVRSRRTGATVTPDVRLDLDLPPPSPVSDLTGLDELALLNRACGVLMERGADPDDAMAELVRQAETSGLDRYGYARLVLESVRGPRSPG